MTRLRPWVLHSLSCGRAAQPSPPAEAACCPGGGTPGSRARAPPPPPPRARAPPPRPPRASPWPPPRAPRRSPPCAPPHSACAPAARDIAHAHLTRGKGVAAHVSHRKASRRAATLGMRSCRPTHRSPHTASCQSHAHASLQPQPCSQATVRHTQVCVCVARHGTRVVHGGCTAAVPHPLGLRQRQHLGLIVHAHGRPGAGERPAGGWHDTCMGHVHDMGCPGILLGAATCRGGCGKPAAADCAAASRMAVAAQACPGLRALTGGGGWAPAGRAGCAGRRPSRPARGRPRRRGGPRAPEGKHAWALGGSTGGGLLQALAWVGRLGAHTEACACRRAGCCTALGGC
jgi:hypothetical protein